MIAGWHPDAALSAAGAVPLLGWFATGGKILGKIAGEIKKFFKGTADTPPAPGAPHAPGAIGALTWRCWPGMPS